MMVPSPGPMVRTISESGESLSRRANPGTGHFNNLDYSRSSNCSRALFHTSFSPEAADRSSSNMLVIEKDSSSNSTRGEGESNEDASSGAKPENEDEDLEMIFMGIGALNSTGIDESEDDNTEQQAGNSTFASVAQRNMAALQQHLASPPNGQGQRQPLSSGVNSSPNGPTTSPPATVVTRCTDGKLITYNPDIYDEADILLTNEKNVNNIRYLKEFRVEQCGNFLQHKCNQHKPFTCFNWHFANQRRRRPIRRRDGTFNYSPDTYCNKYDETTGTCPDNDECPNLHRTAGDTERRYHLRYYKTGMCVYETDRNTGFCMKNGAHCAFAHGQHDLRQPIYDSREQAASEGESGDANGAGGLANGHAGCGGLYDKDRNAVNEDPRWQDIAFVLANYKTDICKRPPRLCRQGYACPQYHNNRDRRRTPKNFNYRSTPCPSVKQGDEWGEPSNCENDEKCQYCHTRTEQQFHPEIYKSTKCNDIQQTNHCPRGPFCAFAHSESSDEIKVAREFATDPSSDVPPGLSVTTSSGGGNDGLKNVNVNCNTSPVDIARANSLSYNRPNIMQTIPSSLPNHFSLDINKFDLATQQQQQQQHQQLSLAQQHEQHSGNGGNGNGGNGGNHGNSCNLGPIGSRPRSFSTSASNNHKSLLPWSLLEKNNLIGKGLPSAHNSLGSTIFSAATSSSSLFGVPDQARQQLSSSSSFASTLPSTSFYHGMQEQQQSSDTALMVLSHMEDMAFDGAKANHMVSHSVSSGNVGPPSDNGPHPNMSIELGNNALSSVNIMRRGSLLNDSSAPINIPAHRVGPPMIGADGRSTSASGFNLSPPIGQGGQSGLVGNTNSPSMASSFGPSSFSRQASCPPAASSASQSLFDQFPSSMNMGTAGPQNTPVAHSQLAQLAMGSKEFAMMAVEVQRYREENTMQKAQLYNLQNLNQIFQQQVQEATNREKASEKARAEAIDMLNSTQKELEMMRNNDAQTTFQVPRPNELNGMPLQQLYQLQQKIKQDLQSVEEAIQRSSI